MRTGTLVSSSCRTPTACPVAEQLWYAQRLDLHDRLDELSVIHVAGTKGKVCCDAI